MKDITKQQEEVKQFWNSKPCDSELSRKNPSTKEYFLDIENERYKYQTHILSLLSKIDWHGKKVLEIGTGVGTDARRIIEYGGIYTGINVDAGSVALTIKALKTFALPGEVKQSSATHMEFSDKSFDVVYSFGVLHHIPEVDKAVAEIRRVLKPGGELLVMLYNKYSINYYIEILFLRKLFLRLLGIPGVIKMFSLLGFPEEKLMRHAAIYRASKSMNAQEWLSRNTDGPDNPYSCVFGSEEARNLFKDFEIISNEVCFFDYRHWGMLGRLLPAPVTDSLGRHCGWHRIIHARKVI
jgi:ubiquinone/menaquinone biosynthesis C-methylase UbiE